MTTLIRPARRSDGAALVEIERAAGERFRDVGMPEIADDAPGSVDQLAEYAAAERSWVAVNETGALLGYVLVDVVDGNAHIEQLSVLPAVQGTGVGRALIDHVATWALTQRLPALTLTTFREVPWNAPLYEHLGFRFLIEPEVGPELRELRDAETAHGLDPTTRVCMIRPVHDAE